MRTLQLLTLALLATAGRADTFEITFHPLSAWALEGFPVSPMFFSGTIVTDGTCTVCSISQNFDNIQPNGIENIQVGNWNLGDPLQIGDRWGNFTFYRATDVLTGFFGGGDEQLDIGNIGSPLCSPEWRLRQWTERLFLEWCRRVRMGNVLSLGRARAGRLAAAGDGGTGGLAGAAQMRYTFELGVLSQMRCRIPRGFYHVL